MSGGGGKWEFSWDLAAKRNTQLDGWRAFAVVGVMWHHWAPSEWKGPFPFYLGLFYFLTLTGFLITRILLREKTAGEESGAPWRLTAWKDFQKRRLARILAPCYAAMLFAIAVGAPDIRAHPLAYFAHLSNFHMAWMDGWPSGTAHYWTLALQMQFYFLWPLVVFFTPRKFMGRVFVACAAIAPLTRFVCAQWFPEIPNSQALTTATLDYFSVGALLALALDRGVRAGDRRITVAGWLALVGYVALYSLEEMGRPVVGLRYVQQTMLSVAFAALISASLAGFDGWRQRMLDHPVAQHIGRVSYGLYLFHTPVPLFLGWVLPQLWLLEGPLRALRFGVFALVSWGLAWLCWRWIEGPNRLSFRRLAGRGGK